MITVDENLCKGCNICITFCTRNVYKQSKELDKKGVHLPVPVNEEKCIQCTHCAILCPDQAITVEEKKEITTTFWRFKK